METAGQIQFSIVLAKQLPQRLHAVEQPLPGVGGDDQVGLVGKKQIALVTDRICRETLRGEKISDAAVLQACQHDGAAGLFCFLLRAGNAYLQSRLILDFFGQRFGGDAVFFLMAELHENSGGWLYAEAALLKVYFFGRGDQLELIRVESRLCGRGLGKHCRDQKQQNDGKKESFFHSHPGQDEQQLF